MVGLTYDGIAGNRDDFAGRIIAISRSVSRRILGQDRKRGASQLMRTLAEAKKGQ